LDSFVALQDNCSSKVSYTAESVKSLNSLTYVLFEQDCRADDA